MATSVLRVELAGTLSRGVAVRVSLEGSPHPTEHRLDPGTLDDLLARAEAGYYTARPADLADTGRHLYEAIDGPTRCLGRPLEELRGHGSLVVLAVSTSYGPLHHLPWELLHDGTGFLLQRDGPTLVVVRTPSVGSRAADERPPQNRPLHTVFLAASPKEIEPVLDFEQEESLILNAVRRGHRLSTVESGDISELEDHTRVRDDVDVVHLTGHAGHGETGAYFLFEDRFGRPRPLDAQQIRRALVHVPPVVFLSACRTGEAQRRAELPSLAQQLVESGVSAVFAWGRVVEDVTASKACAELYKELGAGLDPAHALARAQRALAEAENPQWHLLRLYTRPDPPPPLVTPARTPGRAPLRRRRPTKGFLDRREQVPVCPPERFVGRRIEVQRCLTLLHQEIPESDGRLVGLVVHGIGGAGKSSLANRLRQRAIGFEDAVVVGRLTESALLEALDTQSGHLQASRGGSLRERLYRFLSNVDRLLIVLDEFEENYRPEERWQPSVRPGFGWDDQSADQEPTERPAFDGEGEARLAPGAVRVLEDLMEAVREANREHVVLITSRYPLNIFKDDFVDVPLARLPEADVAKKVRRMTETRKVPKPLEQSLREAADGNPRLLETLFTLADERQALGEDALLALVGASEGEFRESLLAQELLDRLRPRQREAIASVSVYGLPVRREVLDELLDLDGADLDELRDRALFLGLLESAEVADSAGYRVPAIFRHLLTEHRPVDETAHARSAADALWHDVERLDLPRGPSREQYLQEVHRLAAAGRHRSLVTETAHQLGTAWLERSRFRTVADFCAEDPRRRTEAKVLHVEAVALAELGEMARAHELFRQALDQVPAPLPGPLDDASRELAALRAALLNGMVFHHGSQGPPEESQAQLREALELGERTGDHGVRAFALTQLAGMAAAVGRFEEAEHTYRSALRVASDETNPNERERRSQRAGVLSEMAYNLFFATDRSDEALTMLREAKEIYETAHAPLHEAAVLHDMADILCQRDELETARQLALHSLEISGSVQGVRGLCATGRLLAAIYFKMPDRVEEAKAAWDRAYRDAELCNDAMCKALLLATRAAHDDHPDTADGRLREAEQLMTQAGQRHSVVNLLRSWADDKLMRGDAEGAVAMLRRALDNTRNAHDEAAARAHLGRALSQCGGQHVDEARQVWEQAFEGYGATKDPEGQVEAARALALLWHPENCAAALEWVRCSRVIEVKRGNPELAAMALHSEAALLRESGRSEEANAALIEAAQAWQGLGDLGQAVRCRCRLAEWAMDDGLLDQAQDQMEYVLDLMSGLDDQELALLVTESLARLAHAGGMTEEASALDLAAFRLGMELAPVALVVGEELVPACDPDQGGILLDEIRRLRAQTLAESGFELPVVRIVDSEAMAPTSYAVLCGGDTRATLRAPTPFAVTADLSGPMPAGPVTQEPAWPDPLVWIDEAEAARRTAAGQEVLRSATVMARNVIVLAAAPASADPLGELER
ncbi:CHAT domain-containing protein [Streptomyces sp. NPDC057302]|uniref:CHAT domain-containing protein n=1 Tax=Streptomyces sp. NPDC057302 TaxID=3346094 RepID=UPI0036375458